MQVWNPFHQTHIPRQCSSGLAGRYSWWLDLACAQVSSGKTQGSMCWCLFSQLYPMGWLDVWGTSRNNLGCIESLPVFNSGDGLGQPPRPFNRCYELLELGKNCQSWFVAFLSLSASVVSTIEITMISTSWHSLILLHRIMVILPWS